jgi:AcrR family transcriptional regulator
MTRGLGNRRAHKVGATHANDEDGKGQATRSHIKRAIAEIATTRDIATVTLADICAKAKLTTGALYFHFEGRDRAIEEMAIDVVRDHYERILKVPDSAFEEFLRGVIGIFTHYNQNNGRLPRAVYVTIGTRRKVGRFWLNARQPVVAKFKRLIEAEREQAGLSTDPAPFLAHFILNSIEDLSMDAFQWNNVELAAFAGTLREWQDRQCSLWRSAILAHFE